MQSRLSRISRYDEDESAVYRPNFRSSPLIQLAYYSTPLTLSGVASAIAFNAIHQIFPTILIGLASLVLFGLIWTIREVQVTRLEVLKMRATVQEAAVMIQEPKAGYQVVESKNQTVPLPPAMIELFVKYQVMELAHLEELLGALSRLYKIIYGVSQMSLEDLEEIPAEEFMQRVQGIIRGNPEDRLLVATISTSESIKLRCKTGWAPSFSVEDGDVTVAVPKGMLALIVSGGLLAGGVKFGLGVVKDYTEIIKTQEEIQDIRDTRRKEREQADELKKKLDQSPPKIKGMLESELNTVLDLTVRHEDVLAVKVDARGTKNRN